jgi:hypothetical protein
MALFFRIAIGGSAKRQCDCGDATHKSEPLLEPEVGLASHMLTPNMHGPAMSLLLIIAVVAATVSVAATGCVVYVVVSLRRSGHLLAARVGRQPLTLVLITGEHSPKRQAPRATVAVRAHGRRLQPVTAC